VDCQNFGPQIYEIREFGPGLLDIQFLCDPPSIMTLFRALDKNTISKAAQLVQKLKKQSRQPLADGIA
jgi:hypothetical protein